MSNCLNQKNVSNSVPINNISAQISGTQDTKSTFADDVFTLEDDGDNTRKLKFQLDGITSGNTRTLTAPNASFTLVGRNNEFWNTTSLALNTSDAYNAIIVTGTTSIDRFFRFRTGGGIPKGRAGITLSAFDTENYHMYTFTDGFHISHTGAMPLTNNALGNSIFSIDNTNKRVRFHNFTDDTKIAEFDISGITSGNTRTLTAPDASGTIALTSDLSTFDDNVFTIQDDVDNDKKFQFQASGITTANTRTYTAPDKDGTLALTSDLSTPTPYGFANSTGITNTISPDAWSGLGGYGVLRPGDYGTLSNTPVNGIYSIWGYVEWSSASGITRRKIRLFNSTLSAVYATQGNGDGDNWYQDGISAVVEISALQSVILQVYHASAGDRDVLIAKLGMELLREI